MTELTVQPGNGSTLTRITDAVLVRGMPSVFALCRCGAFVCVRRGRWIDGSQRPRSCARCNRDKQRTITFKVAPRTFLPYAEKRR